MATTISPALTRAKAAAKAKSGPKGAAEKKVGSGHKKRKDNTAEAEEPPAKRVAVSVQKKAAKSEASEAGDEIEKKAKKLQGKAEKVGKESGKKLKR
jgi:hypothetical protein